jgi:hypothetical protein
MLLFPLDSTCNWMVDRPIHPGACAISEAILCAEGRAHEVLEWAFEEQEAITAAERGSEGAAARMAGQRFPEIASCIGRPGVRAKLNASLRWAVQNQLLVLTPQVYVGDMRVCDADTDLGLDYALSRMADRYRANPRPVPAPGGAAPRAEVASPRPTAPATARGPVLTAGAATAGAAQPAAGTTPAGTAEPGATADLDAIARAAQNAQAAAAGAPETQPSEGAPTAAPAPATAPSSTAAPTPTPAPAPVPPPAPAPTGQPTTTGGAP